LNIEVLAAEEGDKLSSGVGFDCVVVDAPCTGTGTWRRKPDAKWRLSEKSLAVRIKEQRDVLTRGASLVKKGGRLAYFTCSLLPEENTDQITWFLSQHKDFSLRPVHGIWPSVLPGEAPKSADGREDTLLLTPRRHGTDGFFIAILQRG